MDWFKHDINTQRDIKIRKLLKAEGYLGYGLFWNIVEAIYDNGGSLTEKEAQEECELAGAPAILRTLLDIGLLDNENGMITSKRITECIEEQAEISRIRKEAGAKGLEKRWDSKRMANAKQMDSNCIASDGKGLANHSKPIADKIREDKNNITNSELRSSLVCSEPSENGCRADSDDPVFLSIITNEKTGYPIRESDVERWTDAFPGVDVRATLKRIGTWSHDNPTKRKTSKGMMRFICNWLSKEQDRAGRIQITQPEVIKGTNIKMAITADGSNPDRYKNSPTMEELYQMTRSGK